MHWAPQSYPEVQHDICCHSVGLSACRFVSLCFLYTSSLGCGHLWRACLTFFVLRILLLFLDTYKSNWLLWSQWLNSPRGFTCQNLTLILRYPEGRNLIPWTLRGEAFRKQLGVMLLGRTGFLQQGGDPGRHAPVSWHLLRTASRLCQEQSHHQIQFLDLAPPEQTKTHVHLQS